MLLCWCAGVIFGVGVVVHYYYFFINQIIIILKNLCQGIYVVRVRDREIFIIMGNSKHSELSTIAIHLVI